MLKRSLLIICFGLVLPVAGMADQESPTYQYTMESADKKYVFVMLRSCSSDSEVHFYPSNKYPESGLYLNDGSTTPLWTVDWCGYVLLPSDGIHLVRKGRWARTREGNSEEALTFFGDGKLLKSYRISDLVTIPWMLPHSSSHYQWQRLISPEDGGQNSSINIMEVQYYAANEGFVFDESAHTMKVATLQGDTYLFDLNTGEIISASRPVRTITISLLALFVSLYAWYLLRATARQRLPLWKDYRRLAFGALVLAWAISLLAVGVLAVARLAAPESLDDAPAFSAVYQLVVMPPLEIAQRNELAWAMPYTAGHPYYQAQGVLYLVGFWFSILVVVGVANNTLVRGVRSVRKRWARDGTPEPVRTRLSAARDSDVALERTERRTFREVQYYSRFCLGLLSVFLSVWASLGLAQPSSEGLGYLLEISSFLLLGVLSPAVLLNLKMVTEVHDKEIVVRLRMPWFQKRRIGFADIRQCSIQPRSSHQHAELMVRKYAVWAKLGVLIELVEGDWILIGTTRPQELLEAIRQGKTRAIPARTGGPTSS